MIEVSVNEKEQIQILTLDIYDFFVTIHVVWIFCFLCISETHVHLPTYVHSELLRERENGIVRNDLVAFV